MTSFLLFDDIIKNWFLVYQSHQKTDPLNNVVNSHHFLSGISEANFNIHFVLFF